MRIAQYQQFAHKVFIACFYCLQLAACKDDDYQLLSQPQLTELLRRMLPPVEALFQLEEPCEHLL